MMVYICIPCVCFAQEFTFDFARNPWCNLGLREHGGQIVPSPSDMGWIFLVTNVCRRSWASLISGFFSGI